MTVSDGFRPSVWIANNPLVLASKSLSRRSLLAAVGLFPEVIASDIDERMLEARFLTRGGSVEVLARQLAYAKAIAVNASRVEAFCLGVDQTLTLGKRLFHKPRDFVEAADALATLSGRTHRLTTAFCLVRQGKTLVVDHDTADLHMRTLDRGVIARYLEFAGSAVLSSVGVYQLEGFGLHLFDHISGDQTTILGLPMVKLLSWLRRQGLISL
jgi:septum formation protein